MSYQVGVDLGSTFSAAAGCRSNAGTPPEVVALTTGSAFLPTVLVTRADGSVIVGDDADRLALTDPQRVVRQFIRRIGDGVPILAGDISWPAELFAARFVGTLLDVVAQRLDGPVTRVTVTHPAGWGTHRVAALRDALAAQGRFGIRFLPAPVAAALAHATRERIDSIAVYDLGGTTFEATVLRRSPGGELAIAGTPEDLEVGGLDFDEVVFSHVVSGLGTAWEGLDPTDPTVRAAVSALRRECTAAKEVLSANTEVLIPVALPGSDTQVRLARAELEDAIQPAIEETVSALQRAIASAGLSPDTILLTGGSARIPLITQTVSERLDRPVTVALDPKGIVAIGAALDARGPVSAPTRALPIPPPAPEPPLITPPPLAPPRASTPNRWLGLPRPLAAAAATVLAAGVAAALTLMARHTTPANSDADPGAEQPTQTVVVREDPITVTEPGTRNRPPATPTGPARTQKPATTSSPARTTTTPTATSKTPTSSSTTTTTTSPASPSVATSTSAP